jgi:hypothetical protein
VSARYKVTVERTVIEETEVGRQYENTHKKDGDGNDIWATTPSQFGKKEVTRVLFQCETSVGQWTSTDGSSTGVERFAMP